MAFLVDGFSTTITFTIGIPNLLLTLREREVQPPELDRGGPIDTTTMRNVRFRTKTPKTLFTVGDITVQAQYDPAAYRSMQSMTGPPPLGKVGILTVFFPDGSTLGGIGAFLEKMTPVSHKEGEFPIAEFKFTASMRDPTTGAEHTGPLLASLSVTPTSF